MVELLLRLKALLDIETVTGETALMAAVCNDNLSCVQQLLDAKANADFTSSASHQAAVRAHASATQSITIEKIFSRANHQRSILTYNTPKQPTIPRKGRALVTC